MELLTEGGCYMAGDAACMQPLLTTLWITLVVLNLNDYPE